MSNIKMVEIFETLCRISKQYYFLSRYVDSCPHRTDNNDFSNNELWYVMFKSCSMQKITI